MTEYKTNIAQFRIVSEPTVMKRVKLTNSSDVSDYFKTLYHFNGDDLGVVEHVYILTLNNANNVTGFMRLSTGSITASIIDFRPLFKFVIDSLSTNFIICHNHPSGKTKPSEDDRDITKRLVEASKIMGVKLLDHIIITPEDGYYSFADSEFYLLKQ